ncbi:MAG: hypothetical protein H8E82_07380 [Candidatus Marinimicrobia bacterium]|nr:hypothetical protein [Candidatus Neomarinimicrobiota bacterium]
MKQPVILIIDQGTSSTKGFILNRHFQQIYSEKIPHKITRSKPGRVECDAAEIAEGCQTLLHSLANICANHSLSPAGLGMAFQRSTFLFWDRTTKKPLTPAMSWQDTRAHNVVNRMNEHREWIQQTTGIPLTAHFGGPKFLHSIQKHPTIKQKILNGDAIFGPLSSFVTHTLTGNLVLDESIAGRSLLLDLQKVVWDEKLLDLFHVPTTCLPELTPTVTTFGNVNNIPLLCVIGDQQASVIGQGRWNRGDVAMNYGTSGSVLMNSGNEVTIIPSLLTNILFSTFDKRYFLLEGTINGVGALFRWLEKYLDIPHRKMKWETRCTESTDGIMIPGINGLASPYWTSEFETKFFNLSSGIHPNKFVRAGMESIGFLVYDIYEIIRKESNITFCDITTSGGNARPPLLQFIADLLNIPVHASKEKDMTALGVAKLVAGQLWGFDNMRRYEKKALEKSYTSAMSPVERNKKIQQWQNALQALNIHPKT